MQPKTLFTFRDPSGYGPKWTVDESTVEIEQTALCDGDGDPAQGVTHFALRRILINAADPAWERNETILHELMHVALFGSGLDWLTPKREEYLIRVLSPRLLGMLTQVGFRWPKGGAK